MTHLSHGAIRPETPRCEFGLLGPLRVLRSGAPVVLGGRQQRAVLARLLVEPDGMVPAERLADDLWGQHVPVGAVTTIQTYVSHLREALEPGRERGAPAGLLVTERGGYRLQVDASVVDARVFEAAVDSGRTKLSAGRYDAAARELTDALALWRGEVLQDLIDYEFAREVRGHLEAARLSATELKVDAELALGRHHQVAMELDRLLHAHPMRERLHWQQMIALYRCGRQAEALDVYQQLRTTLAEELGIDPNPEVQSLYLAILHQDPRLDLQPIAAAARREVPPVDLAAAPGKRGFPRGAGDHRRLRRRTAMLAAAGLVAVTATSSASHTAGARVAPVVLSANTVDEVDGSGTATGAVPVGQSPSGLALAHGSLWVTDEGDRSVSRVDPDRGRVLQTVDVGAAPNAVAASGDDVWVVNGGDGTVSRVSTRTNRVVQTVRVGNLPSAIGAGRSGVWVANTGDDTVQRIDPRSGAVGRPVDVGGRPAGVAVGARTVWVTNAQDGTVSRVDPETAQADSPIAVGAGPRGIALTRGAVGVANSLELSITRIDPANGRVVRVVPVGDGPRSVVAGQDAVWVGDEFDGTLTRVDPRTDRVVSRTRLGTSPRGLATRGTSVWVASGAAGGGNHRGGTLRVEGSPVPGFDTIDPSASILAATVAIAYDTLVAQRRTGGAEGTTLVPDLATSLPRPTQGGRVYTFTLRRGVRYSDGELLRPADVLRGMEWAIRLGYRDYLALRGAPGCLTHPGACDLRKGVAVDDAASRVTFHLTRPDPDFLEKLSVHVFPRPPRAPDDGVAPVPGTGPYMVVGHTPATRRHQLTMVRNPFFRQWSFAARPDGYPDRIVWRNVRDPRARIADLLAGRADVSDPYLSVWSSDVMSRLAHEHPSLVHSDPSMGTLHEWLHTRHRPFDDVRVRRALNFAVDRDRPVRLLGGRLKVVATCQIFPPNSPGYRRFCPFTRGPETRGGYHGPDLRTARVLVRSSGTAGMTVSLETQRVQPESGVSRYLAGVLRSLGYRPRLQLPQPKRQASKRVQMAEGWWGVDYPTSSSAWSPVLSCAALHPDPAESLNQGGFCDRRVESLARRAGEAQAVDPATARRLWGQVDRSTTEAAPWVAMGTTRFATLVSGRVGNYTSHPVLGPLLDLMWVR